MQAAPSPVREHAPALSDPNQAILLTPAASPMPANPAQILAQQSGPPPKKRNWLLWGIGGAVAAQIVMPHDLKPATVAGDIASGFYGQLMGTSTDNIVVQSQLQPLAQRLADLEARRADALGNCMWAGIMGPGGNQLCQDLVEQRFQPSIYEARNALARAQAALRRR